MLPYEKFKLLGPENLTDEELLAIFIRTGTSSEDALTVARNLLAALPGGSLLGLFHLSWKQLTNISGIGEVKAVRLKCLTELAVRVAKENAHKELVFTSPEAVARYYMEQLRHRDRECVVVIFLDHKLHYLGDKMLSQGTADSSFLSPRDVFRSALSEKATHIMLLHNHPSGDPTPSEADISVTKRIAQLGQQMDLPLVDHIIIGDRCFCSLKSEKLF